MHGVENQSEIARLRQQIESELVAMRNGLIGLAEGTARHAFMNARLERLGSYHHDLVSQVGEEHATLLVYGLYNEVMDE